MFDGNKLVINNFSDSGDEQPISLGDYPTLQNLKFSPDGKILAGRLAHDSQGAGELIFWDTETGISLTEPQKIGGLTTTRYPTLQFFDTRNHISLMTFTGEVFSNYGYDMLLQTWWLPRSNPDPIE